MNRKNILLLLLVIVLGTWLWYSKNKPVTTNPAVTPVRQQDNRPVDHVTGDITSLTQESVVVPYVKKNGALPDYYMTKREARQHGWQPAAGNLCDVLPGRAIGGDFFSNREHKLPETPGRRWFEADINFRCGHREADRMVFSSDRLVFVSHDHYQTFEQK